MTKGKRSQRRGSDKAERDAQPSTVGRSGPGARRLFWAGAAILAAAVLAAVWLPRLADREQPLFDPPGAPAASGSSDPAVAAWIRNSLVVAQRLADRYPDDPRPWYLMGQMHYQSGSADQALACWEKCLALEPRFQDAYLGIGSVHMDRGEYDKAEVALRQALTAAPQSPQTPVLLANALLNQGKFQEMVPLLESALRAAPNMPCCLLLGHAHLQLKDYRSAKACFEAAVRMAPNYPNAQFGLATACERLGEKDQAAEHRARFQKLESARLERQRDEETRYDDAASVRLSAATAYAAMAEVLDQHGAAADAETCRRRAAGIEPSLPAQGDRGLARPREGMR